MILSAFELFLATLMFLGQNLVVIYQVYEWAIMINMILYQKGNSINEIMYKLSNKVTRDEFRRREMIIKLVIYAIVIPQIALTVYTTYV